jgi:hypothetical protein
MKWQHLGCDRHGTNTLVATVRVSRRMVGQPKVGHKRLVEAAEVGSGFESAPQKFAGYGSIAAFCRRDAFARNVAT